MLMQPHCNYLTDKQINVSLLIITWDHFNDSKLFFSSNQLIMKHFSLHSSGAANSELGVAKVQLATLHSNFKLE